MATTRKRRDGFTAGQRVVLLEQRELWQEGAEDECRPPDWPHRPFPAGTVLVLVRYSARDHAWLATVPRGRIRWEITDNAHIGALP